MSNLHSIVLLTGSNLGDRTNQLHLASQYIEKHIGKVIRTSSLYMTEAWGGLPQPDYINQVIVVESILSPMETLQKIHWIEEELGRIRSSRWASRIIDIDILFYNTEIIGLPELEIPHPEIQNRNFVLQPLLEVMPDYFHPVLKKSVKELATITRDTCKIIHIYSPEITYDRFL